ncbi:MAG: YhjD/YihY/BrkB family envelope integrity protein, partial [Burkholderiales bacterium]
LLRLVPVILTAAATTLLYLAVPYRRVRIRHALIGGLIAGILFELMKRGFALYIANFPTYTLVYGTFAAVPIFLIWIYLSWVVVLFGAVITALLPGYRFLDPRRRAPGKRFFEALEVLAKLVAAQREGRILRLARLAAEAKLAPESCERLLEHMGRLGWVARTAGEGWVLTRDASELSVADVFRAFVFDPDSGGETSDRLGAARLVEAHQAGIQSAMDLPLKTFFLHAAQGPPAAAAEVVKPLKAKER